MELENLVLRPNCLLTKAPLVFVPGPRSIFYYQKMGSQLQDYLAAHGYQVLSVPLPFRSPDLRLLVFNRWLVQKKSIPMHFIMGAATAREFKNKITYPAFSTITLIGENFMPTPISSWREPLHFKLHRLFCRWTGSYSENFTNSFAVKNDLDFDRFLDHCVQLAEDEMTGDQ